VSDTGVHQFELTDRNGARHAYLVTEHPAGEGSELMFALLGLGVAPLLELAGAALKSEKILRAVVEALGGGEEEAGLGDIADLVKLLDSIDLGSVGAEISKAFSSGKVPADLTRRVMSRTFRDGKPMGGDRSGHFDIAYQANYAEMLQATWKVCQINGFFPLPSTSAGSSSAARKTVPVPAA